MKCIDLDCDKEAEFVVTKKSDLSHRQAEYCTEHTDPYRQYQEHFEVKKLAENH